MLNTTNYLWIINNIENTDKHFNIAINIGINFTLRTDRFKTIAFTKGKIKYPPYKIPLERTGVFFFKKNKTIYLVKIKVNYIHFLIFNFLKNLLVQLIKIKIYIK